MKSIGYESTDKKIEVKIYDLEFEISNASKLEELENVDDNDLDSLEKMIDMVLGEGSVKKINEKRVKDGHEKMDSTVALNILVFVSGVFMDEYGNKIMQPLEENMDRIERVNNFRKDQRRYNSRSYRNRGKYGRY